MPLAFLILSYYLTFFILIKFSLDRARARRAQTWSFQDSIKKSLSGHPRGDTMSTKLRTSIEKFILTELILGGTDPVTSPTSPNKPKTPVRENSFEPIPEPGKDEPSTDAKDTTIKAPATPNELSTTDVVSTNRKESPSPTLELAKTTKESVSSTSEPPKTKKESPVTKKSSMRRPNLSRMFRSQSVDHTESTENSSIFRGRSNSSPSPEVSSPEVKRSGKFKRKEAMEKELRRISEAAGRKYVANGS